MNHYPDLSTYYNESEVKTNVCDSQRKFNLAFKEAVEYYDKKKKYDKEQYNTRHPLSSVLMAVVYFVLLMWALVLSLKVPRTEHRIVHVALALLFPPTYIIGFYVDQIATTNEQKEIGPSI